MKQFSICTALILLALSSFAQKTIEATSEIKSATVYLQGAEMNLRSNATVPSGTNDITFTGLPQNINASTIQVSANTDVVIMSAVFQLDYLHSKQENSKTQVMKDSLDLLNDQLTKVRDQKTVFNGEKDLLNANKSVAGQNTGMNMDQLKQLYDFYALKMNELNNSLFDLSQKEKKLSENISRIQNQLNELNQKFNQPTGEIVVKVNSNSSQSTTFNLSFVVPDAGWYPEYDVRSKDVKSNVTLNYKANVYQRSGMDWDHVKLKLSTGNPSVSATGPLLTTWFLDFYSPVYYEQNMKGLNQSNMSMPSQPESQGYIKNKDVVDDYKRESSTGANYTTVVQTQLTAEFDISIPYDVPSDGKPHMIAIQDYDLPAEYHYYAVPKMDADAFLTADISNWEDLNLLPGNVNIFFEGVYVGQSQLNPTVTKDTLSVSLGRDKSIIIKRDKVKDFSKAHDIGENTKQSFAYIIDVKNTKKEPVDIKIMDQYPISNNSQIEVTLDDAGGATLNDTNGKLFWVLHLNSNEEKKLQFSFTVKYPKNQVLPGL